MRTLLEMQQALNKAYEVYTAKEVAIIMSDVAAALNTVYDVMVTNGIPNISTSVEVKGSTKAAIKTVMETLEDQGFTVTLNSVRESTYLVIAWSTKELWSR